MPVSSSAQRVMVVSTLWIITGAEPGHVECCAALLMAGMVSGFSCDINRPVYFGLCPYFPTQILKPLIMMSHRLDRSVFGSTYVTSWWAGCQKEQIMIRNVIFTALPLILEGGERGWKWS